MPLNLFALCKTLQGIEVKRIRLSQQTQAAVTDTFQTQEAQFLAHVDEEIPFDGAWLPDSNELLTVANPPAAVGVMAALGQNAVAITDLKGADLSQERIVGLAAKSQVAGVDRVLVQNFFRQQVLDNSRTLLFKNNTFDKVVEPAFAIGPKLAAIIEGGQLKFKSFNNVRMVFDISSAYKEATNAELDEFCSHEVLQVDDVSKLKKNAGQISRKLIHAISSNEILDQHPPQEIADRAQTVGLQVAVANGKIVVPSNRKDMKKLLRFLDDGLYRASLSGTDYFANSKRPAT